MADEPEDDLTIVQDETEDQAPEQQPTEDEADDFAIVLDGEEEAPPATADSDLIRKMRAELKAAQAEAAAARKAVAPAPKTLGPKPTMEDHGYDAEAYDEALLKWHADKSEIENVQKRAQEEAEERSRAWRNDLTAYEQKKAALPVRDFDHAEGAVEAALTDVQQAIILKGAEDPAKVVYALGRRPDLLDRLAKIADPVKFTFEVAKIEGKIAVSSSRRPPPPPETRPRGAAPFSMANADKHLEKLEAEADKSGDRSKVVAYKREMREREQQRRTGRR